MIKEHIEKCPQTQLYFCVFSLIMYNFIRNFEFMSNMYCILEYIDAIRNWPIQLAFFFCEF